MCSLKTWLFAIKKKEKRIFWWRRKISSISSKFCPRVDSREELETSCTFQWFLYSMFPDPMQLLHYNIMHGLSRNQGLIGEYCHASHFSINFFIYFASLSFKIFFTLLLHFYILFQSASSHTILLCTFHTSSQ